MLHKIVCFSCKRKGILLPVGNLVLDKHVYVFHGKEGECYTSVLHKCYTQVCMFHAKEKITSSAISSAASLLSSQDQGFGLRLYSYLGVSVVFLSVVFLGVVFLGVVFLRVVFLSELYFSEWYFSQSGISQSGISLRIVFLRVVFPSECYFIWL